MLCDMPRLQGRGHVFEKPYRLLNIFFVGIIAVYCRRKLWWERRFVWFVKDEER